MGNCTGFCEGDNGDKHEVGANITKANSLNVALAVKANDEIRKE